MKYLPKILLVDDEGDFLRVISIMLREKGFDVYSISDYTEILTIAKTYKPDVIVLDVRPGKSDGREIDEQLKNNSDTKAIKILLHSAFTMTENDYKTCGAEGFILTPYSMPVLSAKIQGLPGTVNSEEIEPFKPVDYLFFK